MGDSGMEMIYRKVVEPDFDAKKQHQAPLEHVNKLGIKLRSTSLTMPNHIFHPNSAKSRLSNRSKSSITRFSPQKQNVKQIFNIVVPIQAPDDDANVKISKSPDSFSLERAKSGSLPHMKRSRSPRLTSAKSTRTNATSISLFSKNISQLSSYGDKTRPSSSQWHSQDQPLRYETEQQNVARSRYLKRNSQILSHRVDRLYYMSGSSLNPHNRYYVDEFEHERMRNLLIERQSSQHYGRGVSRFKYFDVPSRSWSPDQMISMVPMLKYHSAYNTSNPEARQNSPCNRDQYEDSLQNDNSDDQFPADRNDRPTPDYIEANMTRKYLQSIASTSDSGTIKCRSSFNAILSNESEGGHVVPSTNQKTAGDQPDVRASRHDVLSPIRNESKGGHFVPSTNQETPGDQLNVRVNSGQDVNEIIIERKCQECQDVLDVGMYGKISTPDSESVFEEDYNDGQECGRTSQAGRHKDTFIMSGLAESRVIQSKESESEESQTNESSQSGEGKSEVSDFKIDVAVIHRKHDQNATEHDEQVADSMNAVGSIDSYGFNTRIRQSNIGVIRDLYDKYGYSSSKRVKEMKGGEGDEERRVKEEKRVEAINSNQNNRYGGDMDFNDTKINNRSPEEGVGQEEEESEIYMDTNATEINKVKYNSNNSNRGELDLSSYGGSVQISSWLHKPGGHDSLVYKQYVPSHYCPKCVKQERINVKDVRFPIPESHCLRFPKKIIMSNEENKVAYRLTSLSPLKKIVHRVTPSGTLNSDIPRDVLRLRGDAQSVCSDYDESIRAVNQANMASNASIVSFYKGVSPAAEVPLSRLPALRTSHTPYKLDPPPPPSPNEAGSVKIKLPEMKIINKNIPRSDVQSRQDPNIITLSPGDLAVTGNRATGPGHLATRLIRKKRSMKAPTLTCQSYGSTYNIFLPHSLLKAKPPSFNRPNVPPTEVSYYNIQRAIIGMNSVSVKNHTVT